MTDQSKNGSSDRFEVAVIGGGQAGLAMGYFLAREGRHFTILEVSDSIGAAWRSRWDSLVLFTPRRYDSLPGLPFPGEPDGYPGRDEVIDYLENYASTFELPVQLNSAVQSVAPADRGFILNVGARALEADQVVVATGPFQVPNAPTFAADLASDVVQMHSTGYQSPGDVPEGTVVVVGGGNTGFQIAKELSSTHAVHLAIGSRQTPLPQRLFGRDLFWWLTKTGLIKKTVDSRVGRRARDRDTLIGSSTRDVKRHGVEVKPRVVRASGDAVTFEDGSELGVDAVIWATGYRSDYGWIDLPVFDENGHVLHRRGVTDYPRLFFLGLTWQHTRGSALLGWVKDDAEFISGRIAANRDKRPLPVGEEAELPQRLKERDLMNEKADEAIERQGDFPTDTTGLPRAVSPNVIPLADGDTTELHIGPVVKRIGDADVRMLAYNGSIPGPTFKVPEGATVTVDVTNEGDLEATVHWHGLRLENRYDGTHDTQAPIPVGETYTYEVHVPDPGVYWYHPHIREDYGQEMGLYGNIHVVPTEPDYWPPVNRELFLTLDDVLIEDGKIAGFSASETTHVAMGRFGNVMLVSGEPDLALTASRGEVVRVYFTNTANTRVFNVTLPGARMKLVGGDSGHYEHETFVEEILLSPSERYVVDVLFERPGEYALEHRTPARSYPLASITVSDEPAEPALGEQFAVLRTNDDLAAERARTAGLLDAAPDKTLAFVAEMDFATPEGAIYQCPMHPDVVSEEPGRCPQCGMKLLPVESPPTSYVCPMHPHVTSDAPDRCPECGMKLVPANLVDPSEHEEHQMHGSHDEHHDHGSSHSAHESEESAAHDHEHAQGIEWEDDMVEVNRRTTAENMRWMLVDRDTGAANVAIDWKFRVGEQVKIRLVNEMDSDHPMPHPFHVHGAGRFLVLARDGVEEPNLVWKDTVLVRTGETVDILLDVTNPGRWMAHCHIAEHHESGMMFGFDVEP